MSKIFITGCAKTGTTLVRRLFNGFKLKPYNKGEISLDNFIKTDYDVGKRSYKDIFSNKLSQNEISRSLKLIRRYGIRIVNVTRNKKDTLKSTNGYVCEDRFNACAKQALDYAEYIVYNIHYSDLILNPDTIQESIAKILDLQIIHKWSDFPDWFTGIEENQSVLNAKEYSLRRIGACKE